MRVPAVSLPLPRTTSVWSSDSTSPTDLPSQNPFLALKGYILHHPKRLLFTKFLGAGAFGCVFLAEDLDWVPPPQLKSKKGPRPRTLPLTCQVPHPLSPRYYAVKCLDNQVVPREQRLREVNNHRAVLGHRGILDLYGCVQQDGWSFIVLEYAEDGDMFNCMLEKNTYSKDDGRIGDVFMQVVDAVSHCHRRSVFHRDLKPGEWSCYLRLALDNRAPLRMNLENIMCRTGGLDIALGDFGKL